MVSEIANKWLRQAQHDLYLAEKNIEIEGYDVSAFLAHQAVEKLLKSIFAMEDKKIPRTHYLDELSQELNLPEEIRSLVIDLVADYNLSRYPDVSETVPFEQYDEEIAEQKVETAKKVFEFLKDRYGME